MRSKHDWMSVATCVLYGLAACTPSRRAPAPAPRPTLTARTDQPVCPPLAEAESLEIVPGGTVRAANGTEVAYSRSSWSDYDDGRFEVTATLSFTGLHGATENRVVDLLQSEQCGIVFGRRWRLTTTDGGPAMLHLSATPGVE